MSAAPSTTPIIAPLGVSQFLVTFAAELTDAANRAALAFRAAVEAESIAGVTETTTALVSACVAFDPSRISHESLRARLQKVLDSRDWCAAPLPLGRRLWHVPAVFGGAGGPDLEAAAALAGLSSGDAIAELTRAPLRVLTLGFAPGQPYLGQLPAHWDLPRLEGLTSKVPAGAVVVAVRQLTLFTNPLPTGWRHVAQTGFVPFQRDAERPFPLRAGDEVLFHPVDAVPDGPLGGARCEAIA